MLFLCALDVYFDAAESRACCCSIVKIRSSVISSVLQKAECLHREHSNQPAVEHHVCVCSCVSACEYCMCACAVYSGRES